MGGLSIERIKVHLSTPRFGERFFYRPEVDSTNEWAKRSAEGESILGESVFLSDGQTEGRGRRGRFWFSPKDRGIYLTILLDSATPVAGHPLLTLLSGVAVCRGIREVTGLEAQVKYPNDIVHRDKKMGGILTEAKWQGDRRLYLVVGIGVNTSIPVGDFPGELRGRTASVFPEGGLAPDRERLIAEILNQFSRCLNGVESEGVQWILNEWVRMNNTLGRRVKVEREGETFTGTAFKINPEGELEVRTDSGGIRSVGLDDQVRIL
jgi:BirA family biotin operon repressor/biotin-[acetyl-CoA-carboxylase] ligase